MPIKQNRWPLVAVIIVTAAAFLFFWLTSLPQDMRVRDTLLSHLKAQLKAEGQSHLTIGDIEMLSLDEKRAVTATEIRPDGGILFHELRSVEGDWIVSRELAGDFRTYCRENTDEIQDRLAKLIAERFRTPVKIQPGIQTFTEVRREKEGVVGNFGAFFTYPKTEKGQRRGRYLERYTFENGAWARQGRGRLLDELPKPRPKRP
ncbi:MAG: hypothetical protein ACYTAF_17220 [Planctomycetota bacterium]